MSQKSITLLFGLSVLCGLWNSSMDGSPSPFYFTLAVLFFSFYLSDCYHSSEDKRQAKIYHYSSLGLLTLGLVLMFYLGVSIINK